MKAIFAESSVDPKVARDYARYWFRTPGAQPRNYSTWIADALWAVHRVHPDDAFARGLLPDLVANHEGWEKRHFSPEAVLRDTATVGFMTV